MIIVYLMIARNYIIIDAKEMDLKVGDEVEFNLNYGALLSSMTSPYVLKSYVDSSCDNDG